MASRILFVTSGKNAHSAEAVIGDAVRMADCYQRRAADL